ncbi:hypothetical protein ACILG0_22505 [Pseudomonadota bacterium AL_CKDN230030165-1A_HGKHYDSX7]
MSNLTDQDRTPASVLKKMAQNDAAYPKDDCTVCGLTLRIGVFFDGFGRNRDDDRASPTFFSNVSRLWEAHYDMSDTERPSKQRWFRLYFSGLGTDLNPEARNDELIYAAARAASRLADQAVKDATKAAKNITRLDEIPDTNLEKRAKSAVQKAIKEGSYQPLVKAYKDVVNDVKTLPQKAVRIWDMVDADRLKARTEATVRGIWAGFKKNPLKVAWTSVKETAKATILESTPVIRDNETVAYIMGTGVDTRLDAALRQIEACYEAANADTEKVVRIEISVFGADRGAMIAKQFVNDLVKKYRWRSEAQLAIVGKNGNPTAEMHIRFVGLFDSVASIMDENTFLGFAPFTDLIKQTHKDRTLTIPAAVERCVHFGAAHELRRNQRLDSLEGTRGEQYFWPGSSGDVTGVAPPGSLGARGELSRVALREMLNCALAQGSALHSIESMAEFRPQAFLLFTLDKKVEDGGQSYYIRELVDAYRELVPYKMGADFMPHMEVFLRWLAVRYQDPVFKAELSDPAEQWIKDRDYFTPEQEFNEALRDYTMMSDEDQAKPENKERLERLRALKDERWQRAVDSRGELPPQRFKPLWQRLEDEIKDLGEAEQADARTEEHKQWMETNRPQVVEAIRRQDAERQAMQDMRDAMTGETTKTPDPMAEKKGERKMQTRLLNVWREASTGANPLPPKVMLLFDWLVHDAMLSSWPDHLLASTSLYFRTRDKDVFGKTNFKAEMQKRGRDMASATRIEEAAAQQARTLQRPPVATGP